MLSALPPKLQKFAVLSSVLCLPLLPSIAAAATVVWNPLEDRYDAQLASTVLIGPKGCSVDKVVKDITRDRVEAVYVCAPPDTPQLFTGLYPVMNPPFIVGGGGGNFPTGGVTPTLVKSPTGGITVFIPTGGLTPTIKNDPTGSEDPTLTFSPLGPTGGTETRSDPDPSPIVTGGTQTGTTTGAVAPAIVPLPAPFAALLLGLGCLIGFGRQSRPQPAA